MTANSFYFPPKMKKGDTIGIVAPAFPWTVDAMEGSLRRFRELGFSVKLAGCADVGRGAGESSGSCPVRHRLVHGYLSGEARQRAEDLNQMFADPEVRAVFCVRGGYGTSQILPYVDFCNIRRNPKVFVGYSDITSLHMAIHKMTGMVTFHGPMAVPNIWKDLDPYTWNSLNEMVGMEWEAVFHNPPGEDGILTVRPGLAQGILEGGNLSLIARSVGTFYQPDTRGRILLLEEVDESIPRLDMLLTQLEHAGLMDGVRGILLGDFTGCSNERYDAEYDLDTFFRERFREYRIPVFSHVRTGHGKPMGTVPLGARCRMEPGRDGSGEIRFYRC